MRQAKEDSDDTSVRFRGVNGNNVDATCSITSEVRLPSGVSTTASWHDLPPQQKRLSAAMPITHPDPSPTDQAPPLDGATDDRCVTVALSSMRPHQPTTERLGSHGRPCTSTATSTTPLTPKAVHSDLKEKALHHPEPPSSMPHRASNASMRVRMVSEAERAINGRHDDATMVHHEVPAKITSTTALTGAARTLVNFIQNRETTSPLPGSAPPTTRHACCAAMVAPVATLASLRHHILDAVQCMSTLFPIEAALEGQDKATVGLPSIRNPAYTHIHTASVEAQLCPTAPTTITSTHTTGSTGQHQREVPTANASCHHKKGDHDSIGEAARGDGDSTRDAAAVSVPPPPHAGGMERMALCLFAPTPGEPLTKQDVPLLQDTEEKVMIEHSCDSRPPELLSATMPAGVTALPTPRARRAPTSLAEGGGLSAAAFDIAATGCTSPPTRAILRDMEDVPVSNAAPCPPAAGGPGAAGRLTSTAADFGAPTSSHDTVATHTAVHAATVQHALCALRHAAALVDSIFQMRRTTSPTHDACIHDSTPHILTTVGGEQDGQAGLPLAPVDPLLLSTSNWLTANGAAGRNFEHRHVQHHQRKHSLQANLLDSMGESIVSGGGSGDEGVKNNSLSINNFSMTYSAAAASMSTLPRGATTHVLTKGLEEETGNKMVNEYVVLDDIGSGASGKVKLAFCAARKITVAIKIIRRQSKASAKVGNIALGRRATVVDNALRREIAIMKKLVHPNVVPLYEVIDDPSAEKLYLVMKYADCGAIAKLRPDGSCDTLPLRRVVDVAIQVCSGLRYLHECGVVHRDIKPDNLLATSDRRVMIADFGVSQLADSVLNGPEAAMEGAEYGGTPLFMAPELHGGYFNRSVRLSQNPVVDDASIGSGDMWALGTTLVCLLWGRLPFRTVEAITNPTVEAALPREVPPCVDARCTAVRFEWLSALRAVFARNPEQRPTAKEFRTASKRLKGACQNCLASRWCYEALPPRLSMPAEWSAPGSPSSGPASPLGFQRIASSSGSLQHRCSPCVVPPPRGISPRSPAVFGGALVPSHCCQRFTISERDLSEAISMRQQDSSTSQLAESFGGALHSVCESSEVPFASMPWNQLL